MRCSALRDIDMRGNVPVEGEPALLYAAYGAAARRREHRDGCIDEQPEIGKVLFRLFVCNDLHDPHFLPDGRKY